MKKIGDLCLWQKHRIMPLQLPPFIIEENAQLQLEVSENMNVTFKFKFMDPKLRNPAVEDLCLGG